MSSHIDNAKQYSDSEKLRARARLNSLYLVAEEDWFPWIARQLPFKNSAKMLDVGCGPGWFWENTKGIWPDSIDLTLCDLSPGMVEKALMRCRSMPFHSLNGLQADLCDLPFEDESFDGVLALHMLYHLPDQARGIAEIKRVLRPGGFCAITTNGQDNMHEFYELGAVLGSPPTDPSALIFGYEQAERLLKHQFGNVTLTEHPASLHITDPEDVYNALTSYPPGDDASPAQLEALGIAIEKRFKNNNGVLVTQKQSALFINKK